jgi:hypothetical protein
MLSVLGHRRKIHPPKWVGTFSFLSRLCNGSGTTAAAELLPGRRRRAEEALPPIRATVLRGHEFSFFVQVERSRGMAREHAAENGKVVEGWPTCFSRTGGRRAAML